MKRIEFEFHLDCPYIRPAREPNAAAYCKKYFRSLENLNIPDWCKLEDAPQPVVEADAKRRWHIYNYY